MKKQLLFLLLAFSTFYSKAQWSADPNVNTPIATASVQLSFAAISSIADGSGGLITAYRENNTTSQTSSVKLQRLSASGNKLWGASGISLTTSLHEIDQVLLSNDGQGGVVAIWTEAVSPADNGVFNVFTQHFDGSGNVPGATSPIKLSPVEGEYVLAEALVKDAEGNYVFAVAEIGSASFYVQKINNIGQLVWESFTTFPITTTDDEIDVALIYAEATGVSIMWSTEYESGGNWGQRIYWQKVNNDGSPNGTTAEIYHFAAAPPNSAQYELASVSPDGSGGYFVGITETTGLTLKLYIQRIATNGTKQFPGLGIEVDDSAGKIVTSGGESSLVGGGGLVNDGNNGVVVTWTDTRNGSYGLYAQHISSGGAKLWGATGILVIQNVAPAMFNENHLKRNANGDFILMIANELDPDYYHWYAQKIAPDGTLLYPPTGILVAGRESFKDGQLILSEDKAIFVWTENSSSFMADNSSVYAQSVYPNGVLPVDLISFEASLKSNGVVIKWISKNESNNAHFILEKSLDGTNFGLLSKLVAKDNTDQQKNYEFVDQTFNQQAYYRLTQVDINGKTTIFNDLIRFVKGINTTSVVIYPNPTTAFVTIKSNNFKDGLKVTLSDLTGKILHRNSTQSAQMDVSLEKFPKGLYILKSEDQGGTSIHKIVKQ